jgi:hypothetical protein
MGAHPYWYYVPYCDEIQAALTKLRKREFKAGRYSPVIPFLKFSEPQFSKQKPGAGHASIDEAIEAGAEEGTRSILDIQAVGDAPGYGVAAPFAEEIVIDLFGTAKPSRDVVDNNLSALIDDIDRGHCFYLVLYDHGRPSEILFAGYSFD